jgi:predicted O-methyltransferase YrrM
MNFSQNLFRIKKRISHVLKSKSANAVHSPFLFDFYYHAVLPEKYYYDFAELESLRTELLQSNASMEVRDYGAGANRPSTRKISEIARLSLSSPDKLKLLFKITDYFRPKTVLELGASFGISTLAMRKAAAIHAKVLTLEGCPNTAMIAKENFRKCEAADIEMIIGNIDETLSEAVTREEVWDLVYIDANHQKKAVLSYFEQIFPHLSENSVVVLDDIYWSEGMLEAWEKISNDERVCLSADLFHFGMLFFRKGQPKQHFFLKSGF